VKKQKVKERQKIYDIEGLQQLANSLKAERKKKGFTQEQLSYESEITLSQIARIETVKSNPTVSTIFKIARTLNIQVSELFNFKLEKK
jgi:transcriptional regulator with XRE-family HTH domain